MLKILRSFTENEKSTGLTLIACTILSLVIANSSIGHGYHNMWLTDVGGMSVEHIINDGLMTIFFFVVGLELFAEIKVGQLSNLKKAILPIFAAVGGMLVPALLYLLFNYGSSTQSGAGIPMATDIAFAIGVLMLVGKSVPRSLKIFLTALAVIDDLGAILVIAIFYSNGLAFTNLFIAAAIYILLIVLNKLQVKNIFFYLAGGMVMWYFMLHSGIHPTITGVLVAFVIPFGKGDSNSPSQRLAHSLAKPVNFFILPLFALANTAIIVEAGLSETISESFGLGIAAGLIIGKPVGVFCFSALAVALKLATLPNNLKWNSILGVGFLSGIGFTMSIFITLLAFDDTAIIEKSKLIVLLSSLFAGIMGFLALSLVLRRQKPSAIS
ncbi:MAG: Na+/H+ antiporter NhaA [Agriterribacter sp.]